MTDERSGPKKRARSTKATEEPDRTTTSGVEDGAADEPTAAPETGDAAADAIAGGPARIAPGAALGGDGGRGGIPLPFTGVRIPVPSQHDVIVGAVRAGNVVRENTPSTDQLLYYGGLGALAVFGVVDWPVAAAIGAGVWIARRHSREQSEAGTRDAEARKATERETTPAREPVAVP